MEQQRRLYSEVSIPEVHHTGSGVVRMCNIFVQGKLKENQMQFLEEIYWKIKAFTFD